MLLDRVARNDTLERGPRVYVRANCVGCHKWHGGGGGGYGGAALSLRKTQLDEREIIETVQCGRPGTGMPYFRRDVYSRRRLGPASLRRPDDDTNWATWGSPRPTIFLRPPEIEAVATYVLTAIKGKGEPNLAGMRRILR